MATDDRKTWTQNGHILDTKRRVLVVTYEGYAAEMARPRGFEPLTFASGELIRK